METRFVSEINDMLKAVGEVTFLPNEKGIYMSLPDGEGSNGKSFKISRIVYGETKSGNRYIETVSTKEGNWPVYGEASLPEILVFARKAMQDLPDSVWSKDLFALAQKFEEALK